MFTLIINKLIRAENQTVVEFTLDNKEQKERRVLAFPANIKTEELRKELKKYLDQVNVEIKAGEAEAKKASDQLQKDKKLDTMKEELEGTQIK